MRVVVVGAGGLGLFYGGTLARGGLAVTYLTRGESVGVLRERGVAVTRLDTGEQFTAAVSATDDAASIGPVECVIVCVKLYDLDVAAEQLAPLVGANTIIIPIQNGIDAAERIGARVGASAVVSGVAVMSATRTAPGVTTCPFVATAIRFGELAGGASERTTRLQEAFATAGLPTTVSADIRFDVWRKFVPVCAVGSLSALMRVPPGLALGTAESFALACGMEDEIRALATASGVALPVGIVDGGRRFATRDAQGAVIYSSLYYDLVAGRRLEIDYLNGTVVRLGQTLGIPTPLNFAIYAALKPYADGAPVLP